VTSRSTIRRHILVGILTLGVLPLLPAMADGANGTSPPAIVSRPRGPRSSRSTEPWLPAEWGVGGYIWSSHTADKQTVHLWRGFEVPPKSTVTKASLRVLADNGFVVMLDGRRLGMGSDYYYMTEYDISEVLRPGRHTIAIDAFNETHQAGVVVGLDVLVNDAPPITLVSDTSWRVVPDSASNWERQLDPDPSWPHAVEVAAFGSLPWIDPPLRMNSVHVSPEEEPAFWRRGWFQALVAAVGGTAAVASLMLATRLVAESRAREMLDRERARIARDIHDELGAGLTQLVLEGEVARTELPPASETHGRLESICSRARALAEAMDELVWAVNSRRDTLRDFVAFASKYVRRFLEPTTMRCRLDIASDLPDVVCDLPVRRNLLLAVKEAVNNAVKYSAASQICLRVERRQPMLVVAVEDDGRGFDLEASQEAGNGLANMNDRLRTIGGTCRITTAPGAGCRVEFEVPLARFAKRAEPPSAGADLLAAGRRPTAARHNTLSEPHPS